MPPPPHREPDLGTCDRPPTSFSTSRPPRKPSLAALSPTARGNGWGHVDLQRGSHYNTTAVAVPPDSPRYRSANRAIVRPVSRASPRKVETSPSEDGGGTGASEV